MSNRVVSEPKFEGESVIVLVRVPNPETGNNVLASEIDEILLFIFDLDSATPDKSVYRGDLTISEHWYDTLQTGGWDGSQGYNFKDRVPGEDFHVEGGHRYLFRHELRLLDGQFIVICETTVPVVARW